MIQSDTIRQAIRTKLTPGTALKTARGVEFTVETVTPVDLVLRVGEKKHRLAIHMDVVDDMVKEFKFLPPRGWMQIGATPSQAKPGTLEAIVRPHTQGGSAATQFATLLAHLKVVELNSSRPARIRLTV